MKLAGPNRETSFQEQKADTMALSATIRRFQVELSDVDRGVYVSLEVRAAQHPSESERYLVTRLLAYLLEYEEGLEFGRGVSSPEEATIALKDLTGAMVHWIEVGVPAPERLHKITTLSERVTVYPHRDFDHFQEILVAAELSRIDRIEVVEIADELIDALATEVSKKNEWEVLRSDGTLYVTTPGGTVSGAVRAPEVAR